MAMTNAERQAAWRARHRGEPKYRARQRGELDAPPKRPLLTDEQRVANHHAAQRRWKEAHPERQREYDSRYKERHAETLRERGRAYYWAHPDARRAYGRAGVYVCGETLNLNIAPPELREVALLLKQARQLLRQPSLGER